MKNPEGEPTDSNENKEKEAVDFVAGAIKGLRHKNEELSTSILNEKMTVDSGVAAKLIEELADLIKYLGDLRLDAEKYRAEYSKIMQDPTINQMMVDLFLSSHALMVQGIIRIHDSFLNLDLDNGDLKKLAEVTKYYREKTVDFSGQLLGSILTDIEIWSANKMK